METYSLLRTLYTCYEANYQKINSMFWFGIERWDITSPQKLTVAGTKKIASPRFLSKVGVYGDVIFRDYHHVNCSQTDVCSLANGNARTCYGTSTSFASCAIHDLDLMSDDDDDDDDGAGSI